MKTINTDTVPSDHADDEIWPSATVIVDVQGNVTSAKLYAPGLPAGRHDLFPVRVPYMDEHTEAWLAVSATLRAVDPEYLNGHGNAIEQAVAAIRRLAACVAPPASVAQTDHIADESKMVAAEVQADAVLDPVDYDRVVSICEAHGIGLPVDCVEMVVEIIRHAARSGDDAAQTQAAKPKRSPRAAAPSKLKKPEQCGTLAGLVEFLRRKGTLLQTERMRPPARMNGRVFAKWADELAAILAEQHESNADLARSTEQEEQK